MDCDRGRLDLRFLPVPLNPEQEVTLLNQEFSPSSLSAGQTVVGKKTRLARRVNRGAADRVLRSDLRGG